MLVEPRQPRTGLFLVRLKKLEFHNGSKFLNNGDRHILWNQDLGHIPSSRHFLSNLSLKIFSKVKVLLVAPTIFHYKPMVYYNVKLTKMAIKGSPYQQNPSVKELGSLSQSRSM